MGAELKVKDVAQLMGVTPATVINWIKSRKLPAYKVHKYWRVPESGLKIFVERSNSINTERGND